MDNVERARQALHRVLTQIDWAPPEAAAGARHRVFFAGCEAPVSDVILGIESESRLFVLLANLAIEAGAASRRELAARVNRANWELLLGNFEMDEASGAVRYRCGVHFGDDDLSEQAVCRTIVTAMGLVDEYAAAIRGTTTWKTT